MANPKLDDMLTVLLPEVPRADERSAIALDHLEKCLELARHFAASLDTPAAPPHGLQLFLAADDAVDTEAVLGVGRAGGIKSIASEGGDGTVTRRSPSWMSGQLTKSTSPSSPRSTGAACCFCLPIIWD